VKYSEEALEEARKSQDIELIATIACGLCSSYMGVGQFGKIVDIAPGGLDLLEKTGRESDFFALPVNPYSYVCGYCGMSMGYLGDFEEAKIFLEKGLRHAAQIKDLRSLALAELHYGMFFHTKGDWKAAIEHFQNSVKYSEEVKYLPVLAWGCTFLGHAYSYLGDPETGRRFAEKGLKIHQEAGVEWFLSFHHYCLGNICLHLGDLKNARRFTDEALRLSQKNNEKFIEAWSWMVLGRILGRAETPQIDKAEESIWQGMKILDELKLKPWYTLGYFYLGEL
jgi:tetratricopeptide (TPR) repeat protein